MCPYDISLPFGTVLSPAFSPDGAKFATGGWWDYTVKIFDASTGVLFNSFDVGGRVHSVTFSPDGTQVVTGIAYPDYSVTLWNIDTGERLLSFIGHTLCVIHVDFVHDGTNIISASTDDTVKLWDINAGSLIHSYLLHKVEIS